MSFSQALFERWRGDALLAATMPGERVYVGRAAGDAAIPYATITTATTENARRTTHATIQLMRVEFAAWVETHAAAIAWQDELRRVFDRQSFAAAADHCLLMQCGEERVEADADRGWRGVAVYRALLERRASAFAS